MLTVMQRGSPQFCNGCSQLGDSVRSCYKLGLHLFSQGILRSLVRISIEELQQVFGAGDNLLLDGQLG